MSKDCVVWCLGVSAIACSLCWWHGADKDQRKRDGGASRYRDTETYRHFRAEQYAKAYQYTRANRHSTAYQHAQANQYTSPYQYAQTNKYAEANAFAPYAYASTYWDEQEQPVPA